MNQENKTEILQIPVTPKDKAEIERRAGTADMSLAAWSRRVLRRELYETAQKELDKHGISV